jgi:hypothetical protein
MIPLLSGKKGRERERERKRERRLIPTALMVHEQIRMGSWQKAQKMYPLAQKEEVKYYKRERERERERESERRGRTRERERER